MFLKFCFWEKICSVAFIESALPGPEHWGSALAVAVILKVWELGQMSVKLSLVLQWIHAWVQGSLGGWRQALQTHSLFACDFPIVTSV